MSGVCGTQSIQSRENFDIIFNEYLEVIKQFPHFKSVEISGSYNSNLAKTTFGDMDLILCIDGSKYDNDKKLVKKELVKFLTKNFESKLADFKGKYEGKKYYNSGEIISIAYQSEELPACQIDNIIALDEKEADFKLKFLDLPAEKQGLILGLTKTAIHEQNQDHIFKMIGINPSQLGKNQEYEFNLSSKELQLRIVTLHPIYTREIKREVIWSSTNWNHVKSVLYTANLALDFEELIVNCKKVFKSDRANTRINGIFNSMVSVKSGEVGKAKGVRKEECKFLINQAF